MISSFNISRQGEKTLKLAWEPVAYALFYKVTFRPKDSCTADETMIMTRNTELTASPFDPDHITTNSTYLFNVRVYNYTMDKPNDTTVFYPKADEKEVALLGKLTLSMFSLQFIVSSCYL